MNTTTGGTRLRLRSGSPDVARRPRRAEQDVVQDTTTVKNYDFVAPPLRDLDVVAAGTAVSGSNLRVSALYDALPITGLKRGAAEYNVVRTGGWWGDDVQLTFPYDAVDGTPEPVVVLPHRPFSATALRLLAVITGQWVRVGTSGCDPDLGEHGDGCGHQEGRVWFTAGDAALVTYGLNGGSQRKQVQRSLEELYDHRSGFLLYDHASGKYLQERGRVLVYRELGTVRDGPVLYEVAFDRFLLDSLLAGHYVSLPVEVVRELSGTDFLVAQAVLSRAYVRKLTKAGQFHEWSVTTGRRGGTPAIPPELLNLAGQRPDKLRRSLERSAVRTTELTEPVMGLRLDVLDGSTGGLKLRLTRTKDRASLALNDGNRGRQSRTDRVDGGQVEREPARQSRTTDRQDGTTDRQDRTDDRQSRTRIERESPRLVRVSSQGSLVKDSSVRHSPEEPRLENEAVAALKRRTGRLPSKRQREVLDEVADNHGGHWWAAARADEAPADADVFRYILDRHNEEAVRRYQAAKAREREAEERKREELLAVHGQHGGRPQSGRPVSLADSMRSALEAIGQDPAIVDALPVPRRQSPAEEPTE